MRVGVFQFAPVFGNVERNIDKVATALSRARQCDLLVLPELFNTGYIFTSRSEARRLAEPVPGGRTTQALIALGRKHRLHLVAGIAERAGSRLYNSAVLIGPRGHVGTYRKLHLFFREKLWFDAGTRTPEVYRVDGARVGMMVCFDWVFPEVTRSLALAGADIIAHPSDLVLPYCFDAMRTRSLENHLFTATCDRTGRESRAGVSLTFRGMSQVTGTRGEILLRLSRTEEKLAVVKIDPREARNKRLTPLNDLLRDRRAKAYRLG
jgi:predicted amidohydrolase